MNLKPVKTAEGRRLRDPKTKAVLPNVADTDASPVTVDLDDPHWFRAVQCGDLVEVEPAPPAALPSPAVPTAPASVPAQPAASAAPAAAAPAAPTIAKTA